MKFGVYMRNFHSTRAKFTVFTDGNAESAGHVILEPNGSYILYHQTNLDTSFVCMRVNTSESKASGGDPKNPCNGHIDIECVPELSPREFKKRMDQQIAEMLERASRLDELVDKVNQLEMSSASAKFNGSRSNAMLASRSLIAWMH
jgi:hypothetical protein